MRFRSKLAGLAGMALAVTALAAPAEAAATVCGSSYTKVGSYAIPQTGTRVGTLEVYYSSSTGKNCALAVGYGSTYGVKNTKAVYIGLAGPGVPWADDNSGSFEYYAGPVYVSAPGKCIAVQGVIFKGSTHYTRHLDSVHCD
ncbi:hypothetical protein ACTMTI_18635 [Nonomuraea sp. H19]|uniref:hypothetical protein n=1 Tax=Nonomuraea sp. H19 TaxID=3452206 RepID=UPI003F8B0FEE